MDQVELKACRDIISALLNPTIRPFLDVKKILQSRIYNLAVDLAIERTAGDGNLTELSNILAAIDGTPQAQALIQRARSKFNVVVTDTKPRKLRKVNNAQRAEAAKEASAKRLAENARSKPVVVVYERDEPSQDLMDSRLMVPGSFGMGRRR